MVIVMFPLLPVPDPLPYCVMGCAMAVEPRTRLSVLEMVVAPLIVFEVELMRSEFDDTILIPNPADMVMRW